MCPTGPEDCSTPGDEDCDGDADCADSDCDGMACGIFGRICSVGSCVCPGGGTEICDNGIDDDCDFRADCRDEDCEGMECAPGRFCQAGMAGCPP